MKFVIEIEEGEGGVEVFLNKVIAGKIFIVEEENLGTYEIHADRGSATWDEELEEALDQASEKISEHYYLYR